jgi:hypothetical protein
MQYLIENSIDYINIDIAKGFIDKKTDETYVYFDDYIYNDSNIQYADIKSIGNDNTIIIICPYISYEIFNLIENCKIFHILKLLQLKSFLTNTEITILNESSLFIGDLEITLVYFDHFLNIYNTFYIFYDDYNESFIEYMINNVEIPCPYDEQNTIEYKSKFKEYIGNDNEDIVKKSKYLTFEDCIKSKDDKCFDIYKNENLDIIIEELIKNNIDSYDIIIESLIKHKTQDFRKLRNLLLDDKIIYYQEIIKRLEKQDRLFENSIEKLKELIELSKYLKREEDIFMEGGYKTLKRTNHKIKIHYNNNYYFRSIFIDIFNNKFVKINREIIKIKMF